MDAAPAASAADPLVPDPVAPVTPTHCRAGHPRESWQDRRGRDHLVWNITPIGQRTSRIIDVPINTATERGLSTATESEAITAIEDGLRLDGRGGLRGRPNIYPVTRPRVWRCADCARERTEFVAMVTERYGPATGTWPAYVYERLAELRHRVHFAVPLPRVARGRNGRQTLHITEEAIAWIAAERSGGASLSQVSAQVGVSRSEVSRISAQISAQIRAQQRAQQKTGPPW